MIKLIYCVTRREEVSIADFRSRWTEEHVPLVRRLAEVTGAERQVQSLTLAVERNLEIFLRRGTREPYDAVYEVWWSNARDLEAFIEKPEILKVRDDIFSRGADFIDYSKSTLFFAQEPSAG